MPTAVAAARQSYADHPMVRLETAPPGPCHAVSLQETLSGTFTACATVILEGGGQQPYAFGHCTNCSRLIIGWSAYRWSVLVREPCPRCGKPW